MSVKNESVTSVRKQPKAKIVAAAPSQSLALLSCSPNQPGHADGEPHPGVHAPSGRDSGRNGQVAQSGAEDRPAHGGEHPVRAGRLRWKHGHVHAVASKLSVLTHYGRLTS